MPKPLLLAVAQPECVALDVAANAVAHAAAVHSAQARVVVFPELSLTGYELGAPALDPRDVRLAPIVGACAATGALALAGAPVEGGRGERHIAMLAIDGSGAVVAYRKIWLGGAEPDHFSAGPGPARLEVDGWRLGLAICRDTGVPGHAADTAGLGIDAYVAGIVHGAGEAGVHDARARRVAADHAIWVAIASFAGRTGGGYQQTAGRSGVWAPDGRLVAQAGPEPGAIARATLVPAAGRIPAGGAVGLPRRA